MYQLTYNPMNPHHYNNSFHLKNIQKDNNHNSPFLFLQSILYNK
jgi:hypothetical protein